MFTGIVDDIGTLTAVQDRDGGRAFTVACRYTGLAPGESIAVDGACFTAEACAAGWFSASAVATTLGRTRVGEWRVGDRVNLERALRAGDRLGGHIVQGHVDGVGLVVETHVSGDTVLADVELPQDVFALQVPHGSIAVDGVSLTVNDIPTDGVVQLSLIPFTRSHTTLGTLVRGRRVHVEADVIGKYVRRLAAPYAEAR